MVCGGLFSSLRVRGILSKFRQIRTAALYEVNEILLLYQQSLHAS
jgi:hypothetical protein